METDMALVGRVHRDGIATARNELLARDTATKAWQARDHRSRKNSRDRDYTILSYRAWLACG